MAEEKVQEQNQWGDFFSLAKWVFNRWSIIWQVIIGIALVLVALSMTWTPLSNITDRWFDLKNTQLQQTYELQTKTVDLLEAKVMPKLDDILKRLDNVEGRTASLENRVLTLEERLQLHIKTWK